MELEENKEQMANEEKVEVGKERNNVPMRVAKRVKFGEKKEKNGVWKELRGKQRRDLEWREEEGEEKTIVDRFGLHKSDIKKKKKNAVW